MRRTIGKAKKARFAKQTASLPTTSSALTSPYAGPQLLTRGSHGERAYDYIRGQLLRGRFAPTAMLPVEVLASEIGVSRQPVMEAMRRLSDDGLVQVIPQVGCRVAVHSPEEISDFFRVFAAVEGLLAQLAAERHDPKELVRLRLLSAEIAVLRKPKTPPTLQSEGYRTLNRDFHGVIHNMARSPQIAQLARGFWDRSDFHLTSSSSLSLFAERLDAAHRDHEDIIKLIESREADQAGTAMRGHILGFSKRLDEHLRR